ncbi:AraC family transcriptional regulator [Pseudoteredinibacter isoporae]|uniref:AraC-like DNA-binding protein n=1 Tax=Pseudoteredinibacter isoporae TaxID=570281 RepID=A0A7X0MW95_9GAMM|nr:AraC family transcriptional regulator [Pseudoteredinibacter isoporae]MBB6522496.1 AraC-like DNA-binding protein [Pseudoteredinibacter isoporae]NHO88025.1 AraC family transcriptional regulator [Pseudoteredinibacter isoporae]NIB23644.1 AraC family transcriptional regulator [Pseudoteredinibacter isoporae]
MSDTQASYLHIPTIPSGFVKHLAEPLIEAKTFPPSLTGRYHELLSNSKVTVAQYTEFTERLCESLEDEWLGLLDKPVPLGSHVALLHLLFPSPDLDTALHNLNRFYSLFLGDDAELFDLSEWASQQKVIINKHHSAVHLQIAALMRVLKLLSWLCQEQLPLTRLAFSFEAMPFDNEFAYLFGAWPSYHNPQAYIQFHADVHSKAVAPAISAEQYANDTHVYSLLWRSEGDLEKKVYGDIAKHLAGGQFSAAEVAERLHVSRHTLGRRLKEQHSSYSDILSRVRKDKALHYLHSGTAPGKSIEQLAETLGYVEMASFSRAFKQWFACSPTQYWQRHIAGLQKNDK